MFDFVIASASWLAQITVHTNFKDNHIYAPMDEINVTFDQPLMIPDTLK